MVERYFLGGENVAPVPIENVMKEIMPYTSNVMVIGDKKKFLTMLITLKSVPDNEGNPTNTLDPVVIDTLTPRGSTAKTVFDASSDPVMHAIVQEGIDLGNKKAVSR